MQPAANTRFCPDQPVTRGQMAAFLARTLGLTAGCNPPARHEFCPDELVTRGQMAAFLHRAMTPAQDEVALGLRCSVLPEPVIVFDPIEIRLEARNNGTMPLENVDFEATYQDCVVKGPLELVGDGDDVFDPGEILLAFCVGSAGEVTSVTADVSATLPDRGDSWARSHAELSFQPISPQLVTVTPSIDFAQAGEEVTWSISVHNRASSFATDLRLRATMVYMPWEDHGPTTALTPAETMGDGDGVWEPGETFTATYREELWNDAELEVEVVLDGYGFNQSSQVVEVAESEPPPDLACAEGTAACEG